VIQTEESAMSKYEPTTELIMMLIDVREYSAAATVELGFVDSFEGYADSIAAAILKSARSGNYGGLERAIEKTNEEIAFHHKWQLDVTKILSKDDHQNRDADCLKQALAQTKDVRRSLGHQVAAVTSSLGTKTAVISA
jgi:cellobiose-specific phosphotransferase system component IIA